MRAVLVDHPEGVAMRFGYNPDANEVLKSCGWRWDRGRRVWWGRTPTADEAAAVMAGLGYDVSDGRGRQASAPPPPGPPPAPVVDRITYYERYLARIPADDQQAAYRRLMAAFHPDRYGDEEEAKAINAAWDRIRGRARRGA